MICYAQMPLTVPNFIALGQTMYEKSVTKFFYTLQYFGALAGHGSKFTKALSIKMPNFADFVDGMTDKNRKRHVSAYRAAILKKKGI